MPYIEQKDRPKFDVVTRHLKGKIKATGELNYILTTIAVQYLEELGMSYSNSSKIRAVFNDASDEFYARVMRPYEDKKTEENGDVYPRGEKHTMPAHIHKLNLVPKDPTTVVDDEVFGFDGEGG